MYDLSDVICVPFERVAASAPVRPSFSRSLDSALWVQNERNWVVFSVGTERRESRCREVRASHEKTTPKSMGAPGAARGFGHKVLWVGEHCRGRVVEQHSHSSSTCFVGASELGRLTQRSARPRRSLKRAPSNPIEPEAGCWAANAIYLRIPRPVESPRIK